MDRAAWRRILRILDDHNVELAPYTRVMPSGWVETRMWAHLPNGLIYRADRVPKEMLK